MQEDPVKEQHATFWRGLGASVNRCFAADVVDRPDVAALAAVERIEQQRAQGGVVVRVVQEALW